MGNDEARLMCSVLSVESEVTALGVFYWGELQVKSVILAGRDNGLGL